MSQYRISQTYDPQPVVRLSENETSTEVAISPAFGCIAYDFHVQGKSVFWMPQSPAGTATLAELIERPRLCGNPLLAPWANRIEGLSYKANGKKYLLNPELGNLRLDQNKNPIHGLVTFTKLWQTTEVSANADSSLARFTLDFGQQTDWLAQFPFPHRIELSYRLKAGELEVVTAITNQSSDPMPLAIGFHPYFQVSDAPRDEWTLTIPARKKYILSPKLIPTGELVDNPHKGPVALKGLVLDDVFGDLERDSNGLSTFVVKGKTQTVEVVFGKDYPIGVVYAPAAQSFVCFEPMTAPTNAFNTPGAAKTIAPGATWRESYWIKTKGF